MRWLETCQRDWLHSASGTNYCAGKDIPLRSFAIALLMPEFQVVICYRIYAAIYRHVSRVMGILFYLLVKFVYKCDIHPKCRIGAGFLLVHGFDVVIGPDASIGEDVVVFNGVSMGKKHVGVLAAPMPRVGNRCVIGTGAKLLGDITLGDQVVVGANAVVLTDIAPGSVCVGIPARTVNHDSGSTDYPV